MAAPTISSGDPGSGVVYSEGRKKYISIENRSITDTLQGSEQV